MTDPIEIVCTLDVPMTAKQSAIITKALKEAVREAYPDAKIRGCWVHDRPRKG
jgi:hypothetical protein